MEVCYDARHSFRAIIKVSKTAMTPILNIALRAVRQANDYIIQSIDKRDPASADAQHDQKLVTHLETTVFQVLLDHLKRGYPNHYVCEPGETLSKEKEDSWHLSGFDNPELFTRRLHGCSYSIVHKHAGKVQNSIIFNVFNGDEYTATRGSGAALNNRRIRCTTARSLNESLIATNICNTLDNNSPAMKDLNFELCSNANQVLVSGNPVLDLAMVAAGQADVAVLIGTQGRDLEAAQLLCQESGALIGTLGGGIVSTTTTNNIVAANPKLYKALVQRLGGYQSKLATPE